MFSVCGVTGGGSSRVHRPAQIRFRSSRKSPVVLPKFCDQYVDSSSAPIRFEPDRKIRFFIFYNLVFEAFFWN